MLTRAGELTPEGAAINYHRADLDLLELRAAAYDVAYSALTLHYLSDLPRLLAIVHRALRPDGSLVLTVEHPIYTAPTTISTPHPPRSTFKTSMVDGSGRSTGTARRAHADVTG